MVSFLRPSWADIICGSISLLMAGMALSNIFMGELVPGWLTLRAITD